MLDQTIGPALESQPGNTLTAPRWIGNRNNASAMHPMYIRHAMAQPIFHSCFLISHMP